VVEECPADLMHRSAAEYWSLNKSAAEIGTATGVYGRSAYAICTREQLENFVDIVDIVDMVASQGAVLATCFYHDFSTKTPRSSFAMLAEIV
jgi:hypothetical protein